MHGIRTVTSFGASSSSLLSSPCLLSGISIRTCDLASEIHLLSTKEKQKLSIACLVPYLHTITMTYTIIMD